MSSQLQTDDEITIDDDEPSATDLPRHWPPRHKVHQGTPHTMRPLVWAEDGLHYAVAFVLVAVAGIVLVHALYDPLRVALHDPKLTFDFQTQIPNLVDRVLFVIIILEIFTTVLAHFRDGSLQLQPFLIIGIISAVREILVIGAKSSAAAGGAKATAANHLGFTEDMTSLGVHLAIAVVLVVALVLVNRSGIKREG
jgi:uncharacterized membrane protein (DUF373 family)